MPLLQTDYGYFSDDGQEYVITRPDTPMPWINVIANRDYGFTLSQAGSGYSWRDHASLNRITRWEQDLVRDDWGKYLYLRDQESGEFWSPTWQPAGHVLTDYRAIHGFGYSRIEGRYGDLASQVTYFVPRDDPCELWLVRLENRGDRPCRLQLFTYFEWLLGAAPDWHREFHRLFIETSFDAEHGVLLATKRLWELPAREGVPSGPGWNRSWPYVAFHGASLSPAGFDGDKSAFLGRQHCLAAPQALLDGRSGNSAGNWGDAIGSLQLEVTVPAGEATEVCFSLGAADSREAALALATHYRDPTVARVELDEVRRFWQGLVSGLAVETPEPALNVLANGWLAYQAIAGRLWGRSAYYQTGGAFGFRDQLQDSLTWLLLGRAEETLAQIRLHAAHQYQQGVVLHWWHPLAESGLRSGYSDDLLWLPFVVLHYLYETGDLSCLAEALPFYDGGEGTLLDHCQRAFELALARRSARGLPLILDADWNDGLNATGVAGRGESIWMAHFLHFLLRAWADLPVLDDQTRERFRVEAGTLGSASNTYGWDGAWYWRATTDDGQVLGSASSPEGQIYLNAQTWSVLGGTADGGRAEQAMRSARERLYTSFGALLLAPPYTQPNPSIGYLTRYAPGTRENGGVYVHAACWAVLAERSLHGVQAAYDLWRTFCPALHGEAPGDYGGEPYVMPGNVDGPLSPQPGRAGWTWYTGSAGWYLRATIEAVLGIEAGMEGLRVLRDLPAGWEGFRVRRHFRGAIYEISVRLAGLGQPSGCRVNGIIWPGDFLPVSSPGSTVNVEIWVRRTTAP